MRHLRGFTLIELMVAVALLGVLLTIGLPMLADWIRNQSVASAAQTLQNGIRMAQSESMKRNVITEFALTASTVSTAATAAPTAAVAAANQKNWVARTTESGTPNWFYAQNSKEASPNTNVTGPASLFFNGFGKVSTAGATGTFDANRIGSNVVYRVARADGQRAYCVYVSPGGGVKMCDPSRPSGDPRACAPNLSATDCPAP